MRAMILKSYGGPAGLELAEQPRPEPGPGQALVRVIASSVNPVDWKQGSGKTRPYLPARFPFVPGYDVAGEIVALGEAPAGSAASDAGALAAGMLVHARIAGRHAGGAAEYALVGTDVVVPIPAGMDPAEAAGLPLAGMTALQGLRDVCRLPMQGARERVLVVGASGGVGHLAVQIARAAGAHVVGVCSAKNAALVRELGAAEVVDYAAPDPYRAHDPFDVVLDCVGGPYSPFVKLLRSGGRYASCMPGVAVFLRAALNPFCSRKVRPVLLRVRGADLRALDALVTAGKLRVVVDSRYRLEELSKAWERSQTGRTVGKIVLDVAPS